VQYTRSARSSSLQELPGTQYARYVASAQRRTISLVFAGGWFLRSRTPLRCEVGRATAYERCRGSLLSIRRCLAHSMIVGGACATFARSCVIQRSRATTASCAYCNFCTRLWLLRSLHHQFRTSKLLLYSVAATKLAGVVEDLFKSSDF
jgi:hypothetical protein